jgi:hypothetical protein
MLYQICRVRVELVFRSRGRPYLHVILLYRNSLVDVSEKAVTIGEYYS